MKKRSFIVGVMVLASSFLPQAVMYADNVYSIYPVPQQQVAVDGSTKISKQVNIIAESGIDEVTRQRVLGVLEDHGLTGTFSDSPSADLANIYLGINGSGGTADIEATALGLSREVFSRQGKYDRHCVALTDKNGWAQILILGEHTDATFFGLASLEQMLDTDPNALSCVIIYDYADQQSRGIVEGYYGYPYTVSVKKDLMKFMMRHKMNTYLYGAKSDPYHSQYWTQAYPTSLTAQQEKNGWLSQDMVRDITKTSASTKVNFIWAIHPGNDFLGSSSVVSNIMGKFDKMYQLGVRQFAVFVDDVGIPNTAEKYKLNADRVTEIQHELERKYNASGAVPADTVKPLHFVPQIYCSNFSSGAAQREAFFSALATTPASVTVYTTGWGVWSVPNSSDLYEVKQYLNRNVGWWWNYPCNDNADGQIYPMDTYSNFYDMPAVNSNATLPTVLENGCGIVSNPMQQGEISKTPLFSVANYAWNTGAFNNKSSWEASFPAIVGKERAEAYKTLAEYLRYNDPSELNSLINTYKASLTGNMPVPEKLKEKMTGILSACSVLEELKESSSESDRLLYADLSPWLLKLKQMATSVNILLDVASMSNVDEAKWSTYIQQIKDVDGLETEEAYKAYALEGMGNGISVSVRPSQPSNRYLYPFVTYMKENALNGYFISEAQTKATRFSNKENSKGNMLTSKGVVSLSGTNTLEKGEYVGIALPQPMLLAAVEISDTLAANHQILYSDNGKTWTVFTDKETLLSAYVKYICVKNEREAAVSVRLNRNVLNLTLPVETEIGSTTIPEGAVWNNHNKDYMTDGNYSTFTCLNRNQQTGDSYTVRLAAMTKIEDVRICMGTTNGDYMNVGNVEVSADGKSWKKLVVKGTANQTDFRMSNPAVVKYSNEMSYCDFRGDGVEAQYVRLYLKEANTSKWLRLYEIEVNKQSYKNKFKPVCIDADGNAIEKLNDGKGYTGLGEVKKSICYNFQQNHLLKSVEIYQNIQSSDARASVKISTDGSNWEEITTLSGDRQLIDMSAHPDAIAMLIEWTGQTPQIYEIVEIADETKSPEVTKIEQISSDNAETSLTVSDGKLMLESVAGLSRVQVFTAAGRLVMQQELVGIHKTVLPTVSCSNQVLIVRVKLDNGKEASYKLTVK